MPVRVCMCESVCVYCRSGFIFHLSNSCVESLDVDLSTADQGVRAHPEAFLFN